MMAGEIQKAIISFDADQPWGALAVVTTPLMCAGAHSPAEEHSLSTTCYYNYYQHVLPHRHHLIEGTHMGGPQRRTTSPLLELKLLRPAYYDEQD